MTGFALSDATARDTVPLARILGDWLRGTGWIPVLHNRGEALPFLPRLARENFTPNPELSSTSRVIFIGRCHRNPYNAENGTYG